MHLILERKSTINFSNLEEKYGHVLGKSEFAGSTAALQQLVQLQMVYSAAMNAVSTKLEVLDDEFQIWHKHNPIHHMECRLKTPRSMIEKLRKYGLPIDIALAREHLLDIAGVRVICNYIDDVYTIERLLLKQSDMRLIKRRDYIAQPKPNGYRSLHIVMSVPVFLSDTREGVPVEIQIRTIAMDMWASLEHKLRYKNRAAEFAAYTEQLQQCASQLAAIDQTMQSIHNEIA